MKKILFLFFISISSTVFASKIQGDRSSTMMIPVVNQSKVYEFVAGLGKQEQLFVLPISQQKKLPVIINLSDENNETIRLKVTAYKKADDGNKERVDTQVYHFKAPRGTFAKVNEIDIDFDKGFNIFGKRKFNISFKPDILPIKNK